ncbi:hypothetical protein [Butyrivibrio sp. WCD2001]|uniref:hypothetical protein n=1 Tax=Butyrivibrio sp. WCD2001 TaxID=1280681 RepID=UPI0004087292|nr:hypothetical protein [Butyrivibrio sp. WCD2001]
MGDLGFINPNFDERLAFLYKLKGIDINERAISAEIAKEFFERKIVLYDEKSGKTKYQQHNDLARQLRKHLEKSGKIPNTVWILRYQKFFNCSADYLLGLIDAPTHEIKSIKELTGLDEKSVEELQYWNSSDEIKTFTNEIIQNTEFHTLFERLYRHKCSLLQTWSFDDSILERDKNIAVSGYYVNEALTLLLEKMRNTYKGKHVNPYLHKE